MATSIPPHNVGELIDAAIRLVDEPKIDDRTLLDHVKGPDFPTGGVLVDDEDTIARAYVSGRGSFRLRAKVDIEREKGGSWHLLVSNSLRRPESQADRANRPAHRRQETADPRRREGRKRRAGPAGARAARANGRSRAAARKPVPADRPRNSLSAQPQRARCHPHAGRDEPQAGAQPPGSPSRSRCSSAGARSGSARSTTGSNCSTDSWSPTSTSTG